MAESNGFLEEKDFIQNDFRKNSFPFFIGLLIVISISSILLGAAFIYYSILNMRYIEHPFLQVTNRELSLYLWQDPSHMRIHVKNKQGYLPAFEYAEKIGLKPEYADDYAIAPPELLFLYHTWHRLLGDYAIPRPIPASDFKLFLSTAPEWQPQYWKQAPEGYIALLNNLQENSDGSLDLANQKELPLMVRQAFIGWKNYFFEGKQINSLALDSEKIKDFLVAYPHYARNYWCNIFGDSYLKSLDELSHTPISKLELSPFLQVALFNWFLESP